ncbi:MAG TPA: RimK family alpha-L-glutamate ligase [Steroidobacteraceae bacterium]|jgi:gamma-F420-2:alpha-L-glutamate ligase
MRCWLLFHRELGPEVPEAAEVYRFKEAAVKAGIELSVLQPRDFELIVDSNDGWSAIYQGRRLPRPDLIIPRTGSETSYFTLAVLRHFERQGVAMVNGPAAIEAVADKLQTLQILSRAGLPIPKTILGKFPVDVNVVEKELGFPVVVKTLKGTRGNGVLLCANREQFNDLANLLDGASPGADFIFQQYIKASHGRDVRVLVVNGRAIAAMERRSADGSFKSNISLGGVGSRLEPPAAMAELAIRVTSALNLDVAGVDILYDTDGYRICEANSSPGFQGLEKACGISVPDAIFAAMREKLQLPEIAPAGSWRRLAGSLRRLFVGRASVA